MEVKWKNKNQRYLNAMQAFLDKADNIENEKLRMDIISQMLKCDKILTEIAIEEINRNKNEKNNQ